MNFVGLIDWSFERFIGILIEHYAGLFPAWLAPQQVVVMNITDKQADSVGDVVSKLNAKGYRAISDLRNEKIGFKIRERTLERIPFMLILGDKEVESGTVNVRTRTGDNLGSMNLDDFIKILDGAMEKKGRVEPKSE